MTKPVSAASCRHHAYPALIVYDGLALSGGTVCLDLVHADSHILYDGLVRYYGFVRFMPCDKVR